MISDKPPFQQHWNDTSTHNSFTVLMNFLSSKQWLMYMFICTFTNLNTNACDLKELMFKIFVSHLQSHLQLLIMNINFVAVTCIAHSHIYVSVRGVSIAVNEIFVHMDTHLSNRWYVPMQWQEFHNLWILYQQRHRGRGMIVHILHLIPFYNVLTTYIYLCPND